MTRTLCHIHLQGMCSVSSEIAVLLETANSFSLSSMAEPIVALLMQNRPLPHQYRNFWEVVYSFYCHVIWIWCLIIATVGTTTLSFYDSRPCHDPHSLKNKFAISEIIVICGRVRYFRDGFRLAK